VLRLPRWTARRSRPSRSWNDAGGSLAADWPYDSLNIILFAEAAAAFEELTLSGKVDELKMQVTDAWPNTFRQSVPVGGGFRASRPAAAEGRTGDGEVFSEVDLLLVPSLRDEFLVITNFTGHPSLTLRAVRRSIGGPERLGA